MYPFTLLMHSDFSAGTGRVSIKYRSNRYCVYAFNRGNIFVKHFSKGQSLFPWKFVNQRPTIYLQSFDMFNFPALHSPELQLAYTKLAFLAALIKPEESNVELGWFDNLYLNISVLSSYIKSAATMNLWNNSGGSIHFIALLTALWFGLSSKVIAWCLC